MPTYTSSGSGGDVLLANTMPQAEYMYGCTPTAVAMILGYYDLYGYRGSSLANIIEGDVALKSRATDGNAYDMDAFDTVLGRATASQEYVYRFYSRNGTPTTPEQEWSYTFESDGYTVKTSDWNCLADYLGTGQFWRGAGNLSTTISYSSLEDLYSYDHDVNYRDGGNSWVIRYIDTTMLPGLDLYVQSRGYAMDYEITGSYQVDVAGGEFTFADYMKEIDAGRPVLISIQGHSMVGYGYNASTQEIIFDDCYESDQRMVWGGTYHYSGAERALQSITVIGINLNGDVDLAIVNTSGSSEKIILAGTTGALSTPEYCFAGTTVYLTYTMSNTGSKESRDFYTAVRVDSELVSSGSVYSISAKSTRKVANVSLGQLSVGMHNVRVTLDENNDIQELSGKNNTAEAGILILKSGTSIVSNYKTVSNGNTVSDIYVQGGAQLTLRNGQACDTILRGKVTSSSADGTIWYLPATVYTSRGGCMSGVDVYGYGQIFISSGGTAANTNVFSGGCAEVYSGGKQTGRLRIESGATTTFYDGSILDFSLSGVAPGDTARVNDLSLIKGVPIYTLTVDGMQTSGTYRLADGAAGFNSTISVVNTAGDELGTLSVGNPLNASGLGCTLALSEGLLSVSITNSNASVSSGLVLENESRTVNAGEQYLETTVNNGGYLYISSGGTANSTTVNRYGYLNVSSGGTANSTTVNSSGYLRVSSGGTANSTMVNSRGNLDVVSGGTANNTTVNYWGGMFVYSGVADSTTVHSGGHLDVVSGGTANSTAVNFGGNLNVYSGGIVNSTAVNSGGNLNVYSGGIATGIVENGGYVSVASGANASFASHTISGLVLSNGSATVHSGTTAYKTTLNSKGGMFVYVGGIANSATVHSGGKLYISSGGTATGEMTFETGAVVSMYEGAILGFDLTQTATGAAALVNNLSIIQGVPIYTLTVDGMQASGTYRLADGAAGFNSTISVVNTAGDELGTLSVGQTVDVGGVNYTLKLTGSTLAVEVASNVVPVPDYTFFSGDFNGDGFDMLAVQKDSTITVYMNGEPWGLGITLEDGWEIAGIGDFNGDGMDDFLRVNGEGYVVGEMANGNGTFSPQVLNFKGEGWDILGTGDFDHNGTDDVLIANPTGASETVGLLGYWESGVTWTLINGYSAEWECIATGDFNGDSKCDMLWRNSFEGDGGLTYNAYCTWLMEPSDGLTDWRMVSVANPDEWNFLCAGDFDGDKMNDIAMINDVGVVGIWGVSDGWLSSWSILSAVNTSEWTLAGVADFNADGTDDIAWGSTETGLVGYWQINNKELTTWTNIAVLS